MESLNSSTHSVINQEPFYRTMQPIHLGNVTLPLLLTLSPLLSFKINRSQQNGGCMSAEMVSRNRSFFQIKPACKMIFLKEMESICRNKLIETKLEQKIIENALHSQVQALVQSHRTLSCLFQFQVVIQNNQARIQFQQLESTLEFITISEIDLFEILISFLKAILHPLTVLFQRMGTVKPSFAEKLRNNIKVEKQKKIIKRIIKEKKQHSPLSMETEPEQTQTGVFQYLDVVSQVPISEDQLVFKRGGYFNIRKRKLVVRGQSFSQNSVQQKMFAQKKLSKRKRPNTLYNYEGKIPKQLNFLAYLNNLPEVELDRFAKYYILNEYTRIDIQSGVMIDQSDSVSKDTVSTLSQEQSLLSMTEAIYMDYYDENLEQYLESKGKLDFGEIVLLLRQIFQSVLVLHKVGIVHRDIKPANFMIEKTEDGGVKTKLIDFGQSTHVSTDYSQTQILGFSTPYAPIQCTYTCKEGFNAKQIDLWSLGVVIYQLTTGRMPVTYSKCFKSDIKVGWPTDLNFFITKFGRGRWSIAQNMLVMMALLFMKVKPEDRLNINSGLKLLDEIQKVVNQFSQQLNL